MLDDHTRLGYILTSIPHDYTSTARHHPHTILVRMLRVTCRRDDRPLHFLHISFRPHCGNPWCGPIGDTVYTERRTYM